MNGSGKRIRPGDDSYHGDQFPPQAKRERLDGYIPAAIEHHFAHNPSVDRLYRTPPAKHAGHASLTFGNSSTPQGTLPFFQQRIKTVEIEDNRPLGSGSPTQCMNEVDFAALQAYVKDRTSEVPIPTTNWAVQDDLDLFGPDPLDTTAGDMSLQVYANDGPSVEQLAGPAGHHSEQTQGPGSQDEVVFVQYTGYDIGQLQFSPQISNKTSPSSASHPTSYTTPGLRLPTSSPISDGTKTHPPEGVQATSSPTTHPYTIDSRATVQHVVPEPPKQSLREMPQPWKKRSTATSRNCPIDTQVDGQICPSMTQYPALNRYDDAFATPMLYSCIQKERMVNATLGQSLSENEYQSIQAAQEKSEIPVEQNHASAATSVHDQAPRDLTHPVTTTSSCPIPNADPKSTESKTTDRKPSTSSRVDRIKNNRAERRKRKALQNRQASDPVKCTSPKSPKTPTPSEVAKLNELLNKRLIERAEERRKEQESLTAVDLTDESGEAKNVPKSRPLTEAERDEKLSLPNNKPYRPKADGEGWEKWEETNGETLLNFELKIGVHSKYSWEREAALEAERVKHLSKPKRGNRMTAAEKSPKEVSVKPLAPVQKREPDKDMSGSRYTDSRARELANEYKLTYFGSGMVKCGHACSGKGSCSHPCCKLGVLIDSRVMRKAKKNAEKKVECGCKCLSKQACKHVYYKEGTTLASQNRNRRGKGDEGEDEDAADSPQDGTTENGIQEAEDERNMTGSSKKKKNKPVKAKQTKKTSEKALHSTASGRIGKPKGPTTKRSKATQEAMLAEAEAGSAEDGDEQEMEDTNRVDELKDAMLAAFADDEDEQDFVGDAEADQVAGVEHAQQQDRRFGLTEEGMAGMNTEYPESDVSSDYHDDEPPNNTAPPSQPVDPNTGLTYAQLAALNGYDNGSGDDEAEDEYI
ncbi:hypothetical protein BCR34DRAFT_591127 [Clohesyomyces aquaticus]|uniref:Uncharacterized protein n=1 Tax=Clohesyomyces aquaticus TaxID=1231657 RepID=A0A1Y1Z2Z4_9PLEO|nr:hypothetical protein BCR34DRAFT_591127 [Clohesyomyces aquaticus]